MTRSQAIQRDVFSSYISKIGKLQMAASDAPRCHAFHQIASPTPVTVVVKDLKTG